MIAPPLTRASTLCEYVDWFSSIGAPVESGLQRALLPVLFRENPDAWLSYRQVRAFVADMAYREGVCDQGVPIADINRVFNRSLIDPVLKAPDLNRAIRMLPIMCRMQNSGVRMWSETEGDMVRLCLLLPLPNEFPGHTISEVRTLQLIRDLLFVFAGQVFQPSCVLLTSRKRELLINAGDLFDGVPVYTGQQSSALVFPRELLLAKCQQARSDIGLVTQTSITGLSTPFSVGDVTDKLLEPYLSQGYPHITLAAALIGCSVRTLQRRLTLENTSYSDLIDRVRERAAMRMLEQEDMNISELAQRLGYTEHSAFTRAFRRWTGAPPTQYRSSHKALR